MGIQTGLRNAAASPSGNRRLLIEIHRYVREKIGETARAPLKRRQAWKKRIPRLAG